MDRLYYIGSPEDEGLHAAACAALDGPYDSLESAIAAWSEDEDLADARVILAAAPGERLEPVPPEDRERVAHLVVDWVSVAERLPREGERIRFATGGMPSREHEGWYDAEERFFCERDGRGVVRRYRTNVLRWHLVVDGAGSGAAISGGPTAPSRADRGPGGPPASDPPRRR